MKFLRVLVGYGLVIVLGLLVSDPTAAQQVHLRPVFTDRVYGPQSSCINSAISRGTACGNPNSIAVDYNNVCTHEVLVAYCFERVNGTYQCGRNSALPGGEGGQGFECNSTGHWVMYVTQVRGYVPW